MAIITGADARDEADRPGGKLVAAIGNRNYEVYDGDTIYELNEDGERVAEQGLRIKGLQARETDKFTAKGGDDFGEVGGEAAKNVLYEYISANSDTLKYVDLQEKGPYGRELIDLVNKDGVGLSTAFAANDLSYATGWESPEDYEARRAGRLRRSATGGESEYSELTDTISNAQISSDYGGEFKGLALDEAYFDPKYHTGVESRDHNRVLWDYDRNIGGHTVDPLGTAWSVGWANTASDAGAFLASLGEATDWEGLENWGDSIRVRNALRSEEAPPFAISKLSDIRTDDGWWEAVSDSIEWIGVNGTMSAPYMAAVAGGALAGAAAAPVLGLGAAGATALGTLPAAALHAGGVYNDLNPENRTKANLPAVYAAGIGMAALDRLGLHGIIKPTQFLSKEGRTALAEALVKKGVGRKEAQMQIAAATQTELKNLLRSQRDVAQRYLQKSSVAKEALSRLKDAGVAGASEGVTEVLQEITAYETARRINGEEVDMDQLLEIIANSAAAGFALGGGIKGVSSIPGTFQNRRTIDRLTSDADLELQDVYQRSIFEAEKALPDPTLKTTEGALNAFKKSIIANDGPTTPGRFAAWAGVGQGTNQVLDLFKSKDATTNALAADDDYSTSLSLDGETKSGFKVPAVSELAGAVLSATGRLIKAPTRNEIKPEDMANPAWRTLYRLVDASAGGRNFEGRKDYVKGVLDHTMDSRSILRGLGLGETRKGARKFSETTKRVEQTTVGDKNLLQLLHTAGFNPKNLDAKSQKALEAAIPNVNERSVYVKAFRNLSNSHQTGIAAERQALVQDKGANSQVVKDFDKKVGNENYWNARTVNRQKVARNAKEFMSVVAKAKSKALKRTDLTDAEKRYLHDIDPTDYAQRIISGSTTNVDEGNFSLVGGDSWAGFQRSNLLDFANADPDFDKKFGEENILASLTQRNGDIAKRVAHLEYFGDGGRVLDEIINRGYEVDRKTIGDEAARRKAQRIAADYRNIIDSSSNNYNRINNPTIASVQRNIMLYTSIVGLSLATPASIPEFGTLLIDASTDNEVKSAWKHMVSGFGQAFKSYGRHIKDDFQDNLNVVGFEMEATPEGNLVKDATFEHLQQLGVPVEVSNVYNKWGLEGAEPINEFAQVVSEKYFKVIGLSAITEAQRLAASAMSLDMARENLTILMFADFDGQMSSGEVDAFRKLTELGMDVRGVIQKLKANNQTAGELNYDVEVGSSFSNQAGTVQGTQDRAAASGVSYEKQLEQDAMGKGYQKHADLQYVNDQLGVLVQNFVNQRIQNPGAANRPLLFQDPRFALLTQFNGFISTVTTTLVPKLWRGQMGEAYRKGDFSYTYDVFNVAITMTMLGALGQYLKDVIKEGDDALDPLNHPYYSFGEVAQRAVGASGIFGQFEKPYYWAFPRSFQENETTGYRIGSEFGGPALRHGENIWSAIRQGITGYEDTTPQGTTFTVAPNAAKGWNQALRSAPFVSTIPDWRHGAANLLSGSDYFKER